jgi:hypothetical protein
MCNELNNDRFINRNKPYNYNEVKGDHGTRPMHQTTFSNNHYPNESMNSSYVTQNNKVIS